jgi:hypothetical protein
VRRPVEGHLAEIETDDAVIGVQSVSTELFEYASADPFIPTGPESGVGDLELEDRLDTDPRTAGDQSDQDPPKAQSISHTRAVTAQGMGPVRGGNQGLNRCPDGIYYFGLERAHDGGVLHWVVLVGSHSGSNPSQPDDRWMVTYPRGP